MEQLHQPSRYGDTAGVPLDSPLVDSPSVVPSPPVDVEHAKAAFAELERQLSHTAANSVNDATRQGSPRDLEKTGDEDDDHFNLRDYMQSENDASAAAGIAHKHVGVTWKGLNVVVGGFESKKVRSVDRALSQKSIVF